MNTTSSFNAEGQIHNMDATTAAQSRSSLNMSYCHAAGPRPHSVVPYAMQEPRRGEMRPEH